MTTRRSLPTDQIPSHLRGFVGNSIDVRQVEAWEPLPPTARGGHGAPGHRGAPVRLSGRTRLVPAGPDAEHRSYDGD